MIQNVEAYKQSDKAKSLLLAAGFLMLLHPMISITYVKILLNVRLATMPHSRVFLLQGMNQFVDNDNHQDRSDDIWNYDLEQMSNPPMNFPGIDGNGEPDLISIEQPVSMVTSNNISF